MSYLVRKISRAKWLPTNGVSGDEIPADAISVDLRTKENALSFWRVDARRWDDGLRQVALALATNADRIDKMDLTWVKSEDLAAEGISVNATAGNTPIQSLSHMHVDVNQLDTVRLCSVAKFLSHAIEQNCFTRFTKSDLLQEIAAAIKQNLVSLKDLNETVQTDISKFLEPEN